MARLLIFGPGYTATRIAAAVRARGWDVQTVGRAAIDDFESVAKLIGMSTHLLSSVPPDGETDPVLDRYGAELTRTGAWLGYLSSTGVYGDTGGAWADESAPVGGGRRTARAAADQGWLDLGARVLRLPGIYGPGRSALDRVAAGTAYRVDKSDQLFSRVHVDDIVTAAIAAMSAPRGAYNIADDAPGPQNAVIAYASVLLGMPLPPITALEALPAAARAFYSENRRIANGKAKRVLYWRPLYSSFREGLRALRATSRPANASALPIAATHVQR